METIKKLIIAVFSPLFLVTVLMSSPSYALYGNYGDIMVLYAPNLIADPVGAQAERNARNYEESLLHLQIPQYAMGERIRNEALIRNEFFYHVDICESPREYEDEYGATWCKYRFTNFALQLLSIGQIVEIQSWLVSDQEKYKIPFEDTHQLYVRYVNGEFGLGEVPVELMIGIEYGQTIEDYTNFKDFYNVFMNKHHYCVTVVFWSIQKSIYDYGNENYKRLVENVLSDPQRVQSFDTLTAGRLIGMLFEFGLIEEY